MPPSLSIKPNTISNMTIKPIRISMIVSVVLDHYYRSILWNIEYFLYRCIIRQPQTSRTSPLAPGHLARALARAYLTQFPRWPHILCVTSYARRARSGQSGTHTHSSAVNSAYEAEPRVSLSAIITLLSWPRGDPRYRWFWVSVVLLVNIYTHTHVLHTSAHTDRFIDVSVWSHGCLYSSSLMCHRVLLVYNSFRSYSIVYITV